MLLTVLATAQCTTMSLSMTDSYGDGWNGATYEIVNTETGATVATGSLDNAMSGDGLNVGTDQICLPDGCYQITAGGGIFDFEVGWSLTNTSTGLISGGTTAPVFFQVGAGCAGGCELYTFSAFGDLWDAEISWRIVDENNVEMASGQSTTGVSVCLSEGCYIVEMFDSFGDGWGLATWTLQNSFGVIVDSGTLLNGSFGVATLSIGGQDCSGFEPEPGDGIVVESGVFTPQALISDVFLGNCLEASNIVYTGSPSAIGTFSNGGAVGIEEGIILSTGNVMDAEPNGLFESSTGFFLPGSPLLDNISNDITNDAAVFTFDFTASTSEVTFTYVFASEEYPEYVCSLYNDAFGFFVSGPGYAPNTNIATIPGTAGVPVTIDNVNNDPNCLPNYPAYYVGNPAENVLAYDGYTTPLTATISTVPCETYQITIAVGDAGDAILDSAVLLQAQSFSAGVDVEVTAANLSGVQSTPSGCDEGGSFVFVNGGEPFSEDVTVSFLIGGTAQSGNAYEPIATEVTFPAGTDLVELDVNGVLDQLQETPQTVTVTLNETCSCSPPPEIALYLCQQLFLTAEWGEFEVEWANMKREAQCAWTTLSEENLEYFSIERSADGSMWEPIGQVDAVGSSAEKNDYAFTDVAPLSGRSYYRIKAVDINNEANLSAVRTLYKEAPPSLTIYPNPGNGHYQLAGYDQQEIVLYNTLGEKVAFEVSEAGKLNLMSCASGVYHMIVMHQDAVVQTERLVVE